MKYFNVPDGRVFQSILPFTFNLTYCQIRGEGLCLFDVPATGGAGGYTYSDWSTFMSSGQAKITKFTVRSGSAVDW